MNLHDQRIAYVKGELTLADLPPHPMSLLVQWLAEAQDEYEPNAVALGTVDEHRRPSVRYVLIKEVRSNSVVFFTNYNSRKGVHIAENPFAAVTFWWPKLERQVRVEGTVQRLPGEESDAYFAARPLESQIGAVASPQSAVIPSRSVLEDRAAELRKTAASGIARPDNWGGFEVVLDRYEFWQGRDGRMHDRFEALPVQSAWQWRRLAP